ncbi:MAG TPA: TlpA disulfide reductase family protein [Planctomycetota bacterium]|nr:TlpA disulfide reductase family protein [Planctomycetota bacterium]
MRRFIAALLACSVLLACEAEVEEQAAVVKVEPSVTIAGLEGIDAVLAQQRGHGVLLNFWALWCAPCVAELPHLMEVAREYEAKGGRVVLVSYDIMVPGAKREKALADVRAFAKERGIGVPIVIYEAPNYETINEHLNLPGGVPVTLAIDANGKVVDMQDGETDKARFVQLMEKALGAN